MAVSSTVSDECCREMNDENEMAEAGLGATALTAEERNELLRCYHLPEFVPLGSEDDDDDDVRIIVVL